MDSFISVLSFSLIPLLTAALFALVMPPLGAILSLRNEMMLGIALPPAGSAVLAGIVFLGLSPEGNPALPAITAAALFGLMLALPLNNLGGGLSLRRRELVLAAVFCLGHALTLLFMNLSAQAHSNLMYLLQGELLAIRGGEFRFVLVWACLFIALGIPGRGALFAYALDEQNLQIKSPYYALVKYSFRAAATLIITGGIILIGPLLCTALLVLPALLTERHSRGLVRFVLANTLVGLAGTVVGFLASIRFDLAPGPLAVCGIFGVGLMFRFFGGLRAQS